MKKILYMMSAFALLTVSSIALVPTNADAIPVFARKYGMECNSCHTMYPQLSKMGVAFRERGFRFAAGRDDIDNQDERGKNFDAGDNAVFASTFPFTVRTQILYSDAGPVEIDGAGAVMPGHRPGMLDGATDNAKMGTGEFGMISSGSYDTFSWWLDASNDGIGMLEGIYYVSDLVKIRMGRVQNTVGYGMTMMSKRPIGFGWADSAQMAGGTMLMMSDGISIHGTTDGSTGVGTSYNLSYGLSGNDSTTGDKATNTYARVSQELMDSHVVGAYVYSATNYTSDVFGGESAMYMGMVNPMTGAEARVAMAFDEVKRFGVDFAYNYGEPFQVWGAYTTGDQTNANGTTLDVTALTIASEWIVEEGWMLGGKYNSSQADLQMAAFTPLSPSATTHTTLYGIHQLAENVQAILSFTKSANVIHSMSAAAGATTVDQSDFNTMIFAVDIAL